MGYYTGDYYQGDYYAYRTGDPFLGGLGKLIGGAVKGIGKIAGKLVKPVLKSVPVVGTAISVAEGVAGLVKAAKRKRAGTSFMPQIPGGPVLLEAPATTASGQLRPAPLTLGRKKYRSMNYANGKAAHRAVRRLAGTHKLLQGIERAARRAIPIPRPAGKSGSRKCKCS